MTQDKISLQALGDPSKLLQSDTGEFDALISVLVQSLLAGLFLYRVTMFASLIIVVPSFPLAQAEYHHPGRALFQVQVFQGLFQLHFSRFIIQSKHSGRSVHENLHTTFFCTPQDAGVVKDARV